MSELFRDLSPEEIKLATIQFMGQHLTGDLKVLDSHLVNKNRTCQGMTINPVEVVNNIGHATGTENEVTRNVNHFTGPGPVANVVNAGVNLQHQSIPNVQPMSVTVTGQLNDPNQLEFDFNNSPYSKQIFDSLERIESKLNKIINLVEKTD